MVAASKATTPEKNKTTKENENHNALEIHAPLHPCRANQPLRC